MFSSNSMDMFTYPIFFHKIKLIISVFKLPQTKYQLLTNNLSFQGQCHFIQDHVTLNKTPIPSTLVHVIKN